MKVNCSVHSHIYYFTKHMGVCWITCHMCQACQHGLRAHVTNACQLFIITCRANKRVSVPKMCQLFNLACQRAKGVQIFCQFFNCFSKEFFNFSIFQSCLPFENFKNIWAILENLSCGTKSLNFDICKISLRKNLST